MYVPKNPHVPQTPTKKLKLLSALSFIAVVFFALAVVILSLQLITQYKKISSKNKEIATLATTLEKSTDELIRTRRELIAQGMLPPVNSFTSQCPEGNEKDGLFTPLSNTPVEGYNVFLVHCRSSISAGTVAPRIIVFKVNNDGTKEFTYGSNESEPLCISNKIPIANKIALKISLPVCQNN